jgi:GTP-binding protein Era
VNRPGSQIVFVDTPGIHRSGTLLNQRIVDQALQAVEDVDLVLFMVDAVSCNHSAENMILSRLKQAGKPVILVLNKIDLAGKQAVFERAKALAPEFEFAAVIPVSARQNIQVDQLMDEVESHLPQGPPLYPEDTFTDVTEKFLVKEIIREKVFRLTGMEIPYSSAVTVDAFEVEKRCIVIHASIHVVRDSQKGIIIGKKGAMLSAIGTRARQDMEKMLGRKVLLKLFVKVTRDWVSNQRILNEFGY